MHCYLVVAKEQPTFPEGLQYPPERLYVVVLIRDIRVLEVNPEGDAIRETLVFLYVAPDTLFACFIELCDAKLLDVRLAFETQHFFNLELDRQAMRIPTCTCTDMVNAGAAISSGRAGVHHIGARAGWD